MLFTMFFWTETNINSCSCLVYKLEITFLISNLRKLRASVSTGSPVYDLVDGNINRLDELYE